MSSKRTRSRGQKVDLLLWLYDGRCFWCGLGNFVKRPNKAMSATIDELLPTSRGGLRVIENQVVAHRACNTNRGNMVAPLVAVERHHAMLRNIPNPAGVLSGINPGGCDD